jgi:hypothetical protein
MYISLFYYCIPLEVSLYIFPFLYMYIFGPRVLISIQVLFIIKKSLINCDTFTLSNNFANHLTVYLSCSNGMSSMMTRNRGIRFLLYLCGLNFYVLL